jgi:hypothetical protein
MSQAFATPGQFQERFKFERNDNGELVQVVDQSIKMRFSIKPYIDFIKESLTQEQALMANKSEYEKEMAELFADQFDKSSQAPMDFNLFMQSMEEVNKLEVEEIFNNPQFQEVIASFEDRIATALDKINPNVLARLDNPQFFYHKRATYQALKWALDFAKSRLSSVPLLNTASYVLVEVEKMIRERRTFHQNMMLHYMERFTPEELGLTQKEGDLVFSSIYESRIDWFNIWESRAAQANWGGYGLDRFYQEFRLASNRLRDYRHSTNNLGERFNYAFQEADVEGEHVILNLMQTEAMFKGAPAVAYSFNEPKKVVRKRVALMLSDLGLSFVPLPQFIKNIASSYIKSQYEQHRITEGALFAHFEIQNQREMLRNLMIQYLNPFDIHLIL